MKRRDWFVHHQPLPVIPEGELVPADILSVPSRDPYADLPQFRAPIQPYIEPFDLGLYLEDSFFKTESPDENI